MIRLAGRLLFKFKTISQLLCVCALLLLLTSCVDSSKKDDRAQVPFQAQVGEFTLQFLPGHLPVETLIGLSFESTEPLQSIKVVISGVGMYMGSIPVLLKPDGELKRWQGEFMLGACTDPQMKWRITFDIVTAQGQQRREYFEFQSSFGD